MTVTDFGKVSYGIINQVQNTIFIVFFRNIALKMSESD